MVLTSTSATALLVTSTFCRDGPCVGFPRSSQPPMALPAACTQAWAPPHLLHLLEVIVQLGPLCAPNLLADQLGDRRGNTEQAEAGQQETAVPARDS